ncbi:uncharacterized protein FOMMEDRAFT_110524 [Fomitiporia mediterranea MF3/22]|uniref:uncharacterized protein n=1 Tax=Fomitiporia mediterranea (strain MF3/22) TaxID=694068 RepID=UPI00044087EB|nr:uncharacterized protein FOMMEDRAFT_110524 [Fomitiporia mediterranea MF3/22]EJD01029.1 hypothetical protein FOMMEDRAFT_110524 [Fomitiporia mediterranea MF3/22]
MSTAAQRAKRREEVDHAYNEVAKAASWGAVKYGTVGAALATIGHFTWPAFRRQTLAFKGFLTMGFVCTGLIIHGESRLLAHERQVRHTETKLRREARLDLARRGLVGTETEIAKWKEERAKRISEEAAQGPVANSTGNTGTGSSSSAASSS